MILGEAGIGKSRLAEELCAWVERQGASVSRTRSYAAEGRLAFAPVAEWLRSPALRARLSQLEPIWRSEVSRILPELQVRRTAASEDPAAPRSWQRHRLLEGLSRAVLLARQPLLLLLDDMQWTDHETLEWLRYLLRFAPRAGLLVLGTIRTEELGSDHPLQRFLLDLGRDGQIGEVQLGPLTADDAALVAADVAGRPLSSAQAAQLYRETEGNPLFVVESMRAGEPAPATAEAALAAGAPGAGVTHLPPKVHAVIKTRLSQLSAAAAELAGVAAVLGRAFSFELLAAVSAGPEAALVHALDELWQRRILHETGRGTYDFTHDKLREVAYAQVHAPRRHVLHRRAAEALERMSVSDASSAWPQIAAHLEAAGLPLPALDAYQRAAEAAKRLHANEEAIRLFGRALALLLTTPRSRARLERQLELTRALGVCLVAARGYPDPSVWGVYESAGELCRQLGRPTEPPILRALAIASLTSGDLRRAEALGHELLSLATHADDAVVRVEGHYVLGVSYFWLGRFAESRTQLEASLACHDRRQREVHVSLYAQDPEAVCLCRLAMALYYLGDPEAAWARLDEALVLIRELEHPHTQAYVLCFGALLCVDMRESRRAAELLDALQVLTEAHPLDFWALRGEILRCIQRAADGGNVGEIDQAKRHMAAYARVGDRANASQFLGLQAQAHLARGEIDAGLAALDDAFAVLERIDERYFVAELHRLRGELLLAGGAELARAEACFARALELARAQGACSWELRAATSLGRLWQRRGLEQRVRELLEPLCARYGRSAQTPDLRDARALLDPPSAS